MNHIIKSKYLILLASTLLFTACSVKEPLVQPKPKDLQKTTSLANDNFMNQYEESNKLLKKHFTPWEQTKVSYKLLEATWGFNYQNKTVYLENHIVASQQWFDKQILNANFEMYNQEIKKAITLKNTNVRVLPTSSPMFYNPKKPGEGFPFDYNQNSLIKINTPIIISHFSKDRAWAYMQSSSVGGWVSIKDIAFVDEQFISQFKTNTYKVAVKEKFPLYNNIFREYIKVGTIFPSIANRYLIARADINQNAVIADIHIKDTQVEAFPLKYNTSNRIKIAKQLLNEPYGWGGLLNNRDCSSFTKDFFAPFGKHLARNSKGQTKNGKYHDISNMTKKEKKDYIRKNAVPFSTLVYLKGHIMLYVGMKSNEPLVMHNLWSVRLKNSSGVKYRHIVGKASITTLEPGKELKDFDENNNVLRNIKGIVVL